MTPQKQAGRGHGGTRPAHKYLLRFFSVPSVNSVVKSSSILPRAGRDPGRRAPRTPFFAATEESTLLERLILGALTALLAAALICLRAVRTIAHAETTSACTSKSFRGVYDTHDFTT